MCSVVQQKKKKKSKKKKRGEGGDSGRGGGRGGGRGRGRGRAKGDGGDGDNVCGGGRGSAVTEGMVEVVAKVGEAAEAVKVEAVGVVEMATTEEAEVKAVVAGERGLIEVEAMVGERGVAKSRG